MSESWKTIPVNSGLLVALLAGVVATVLTVHGVQLWVDNRVDSALDYRLGPIEREQHRQAVRIERLERRTRMYMYPNPDKDTSLTQLLLEKADSE